jgi:hypothetical protein
MTRGRRRLGRARVLGHSKQACSLSLREASTLNQLAEPNHQICPDLETLNLFLGESEVSEHVTGGASNFDRHRAPFFFCPRTPRKSARRLRAKAMSASLVLGERFSNAWMT